MKKYLSVILLILLFFPMFADALGYTSSYRRRQRRDNYDRSAIILSTNNKKIVEDKKYSRSIVYLPLIILFTPFIFILFLLVIGIVLIWKYLNNHF